MNDAVEAGFSEYVQTAMFAVPEFIPAAPLTMHWYTAGFAGTLELPWVGFEILGSDALHPDTPVSQGQLKVTIETQADDESEAIHTARVNAVDVALRDWRAVSEAITAGGEIRIYGFALAHRGRELKDSHWISELLYDVGFGPA